MKVHWQVRWRQKGATTSQVDFNSPGLPLATALLNLNLILTLEKKGFYEDETNEIVEHALLNLKMHQALAQDQTSFLEARAILEWLRQALRGALPSPRQRPFID